MLVDGSRIVVADSGELTVEASGQGSIQMSDAPASPATSTVSLFRSNLVALRAVRYLNWTAMPDAVALIDNITY